MAHYKATNTQTNEVVEYDADGARPEHLVDPWDVSRVIVPDPPTDDVPPPDTRVYGGRRTISKLDFLRLFTQGERVAIMVFSAGTGAPNVAVRDYMYLLEQATEVNLDDAEISAGVGLLEAGGLLASGRAAEILNG
jgi:hypothetical protein